MSKTYDGTRIKVKADLHEWWAARLKERIKPEEVSRTHEEMHSLLVRGDTIYSYGTHFPMAEVYRTNGRAHFVLINGDSWSGASGWGQGTGYDQGIVRRNVAASGVPYAVIPFSALDAAGIDHGSLKVIESRPDRHTFHERTSAERPGKPVKVPDPDGRTTVEYTPRYGSYRPTGEEHEGQPIGQPCAADAEGAQHGSYFAPRDVPLMVDSETKAHAPGEAHGWADFAELQSDGMWHWTIKRHWLGDALIRGRTTETRYRKPSAEEREQWDAANAWHVRERELRNEASAAVNLAYYAKLALKEGREELHDARSGDTWMVNETLVEETGFQRDWAQALVEDHARDEVRYPSGRWLSDGSRVVYTITRWAYYLSSFDYNEPHTPYFMCELPSYVHRDGQRYTVKPETIDEAIDWLRPDTVVQAQRAGLDVLRQGDIFAIPTAYTTADLLARCKDRQVTKGKPTVLGTNHAPTHAIFTDDGEVYGRGRLYHTPQGFNRTPDHRVVELGDRETWYRLVKNTVPLDKATGSSRGSVTARSGGIVNQSGQSRAWMLGGGVD